MSSPFLDIPSSEWVGSNDLAFAIRDGFPVSLKHTLIIPRRLVATWWEATPEEQQALFDLLQRCKDDIDRSQPKPDGYNIGINSGEAAGQTVMHLHVHLIPRYRGDVPDPRGGVRHVIPGKGNYLIPPGATLTQRLTRGEKDPLLPLLERDLGQAKEVDIAVAFVMRSGVQRLDLALTHFLATGGHLRLVTGDYLDITDPDALRALLDLQTAHPASRMELRVFQSAGTSFHPKSYLLRGSASGAAYVGSSNLSSSALNDGVEWNYRIIPSADRAGFDEVREAFENLFSDPRTRPIDEAWIEGYRKRRRPKAIPAVDSVAEPIKPPPEPTSIQSMALEKLEATRNAGNNAGLVVLATGLGKTWLSAFDFDRGGFKRALFVAHRDEILDQAMKTFRRIRPQGRLGSYTGNEKALGSDVLFASVQTLGRQAHLDQFPRDAFDYIVVDEFHHASAPTYRRLIQHFRPRFLLGLTATPERTDGGDLLQLCGENLVLRVDLVEGINQQLLCPFHYFGVPDEVDYANIPWRSSRFDEVALTHAVATQSRAQNALEQWQQMAGPRSRTLAFCVSQVHADFMAEFFRGKGIRAAAVHSGDSSDPRAASLEQLGKGELQVVFAVDMLNEGVDIPSIDAVLMLRPTESAILWLQQFGRGLRLDPGNPAKRLVVVDYIGNHRTFLLKPRTLLNVGSKSDRELLVAFEAVASGDWELPAGCEITYDLKAMEILKGLLRLPKAEDVFRSYYEDYRERQGVRPTAAEAWHDHYDPRTVRNTHGSWFEFVRAMGDLSSAEAAALSDVRAFIDQLERTEMNKSFKMLVLQALLNRDALGSGILIADLVDEFASLVDRSQVYRREVGSAVHNPAALQKLIENNPIDAWAGGKGTGGTPFFQYEKQVFKPLFRVAPGNRVAFAALVQELVDYRLAKYLDRNSLSFDQPNVFTAKVTHNPKGPILMYDRAKSKTAIPTGSQPILIDGEEYEGNFAKIALNVIRKKGSEENALPRMVRGWFGPDAGKSGTNFLVAGESTDDGVILRPAVQSAPQGPALWKKYSREQIPGLFGLKFSTAIWNKGFVVTEKGIFLLVTLNKAEMRESFRYADHFVSPTELQWQSQNRTSRGSGDGQLIQHHRERGVAVQLFVRAEKKIGAEAAPFIYCGPVTFIRCQREKPITVWWRLKTPVPKGSGLPTGER